MPMCCARTGVGRDNGKCALADGASHGKELSADFDYDPSDSTHATSLRTSMLSSLSSKISKLFYKWKPDNPDEENAGG